jgi:Tfp pilus assembly protein PilX
MSPPLTSRSRQRGVSLVSAVFLIVVLASLAAFAVRVSVLQQQTVNSSLLAAQAFHAARSGIAWGAQRALSTGWCASQTLSLSEAGTNGFTVEVQCSQSTHNEAGAFINIYILDVLAHAGTYGGPDYVSRRIQAKVTDAG